MNVGMASLRIGLGLIVALGAVVGIVYATDYGVQATVVGKDCGSSGGSSGGGIFPVSGPSVTVKTKMAGLRHTQSLPAEQCGIVQVGNFVIYHIRSGRTSLYQSEGGTCIYDSVGGVNGCP